MEKKTVIDSIRDFINSRPGFNPNNYEDAASYRADQRKAQKDKAIALHLLGTLTGAGGITAETMLAPQTGRFTIAIDGDKVVADYRTGQGYATEYRAGVCVYLSSLLWDYMRDYGGLKDGDAIRAQFRELFGTAIQRRFFS